MQAFITLACCTAQAEQYWQIIVVFLHVPQHDCRLAGHSLYT